MTVTNRAARKRSVNTDDEGRWKSRGARRWHIQSYFAATGFKKATSSNIEVEAAVPRTVNVQLETGAVEETVNVVAGQRFSGRETAATFRQINAEELPEVPTSTRSFTHLLSAEGGV